MFAVIYRGFVYPDREEDYQRLWNQVANHFVTYRGALGSCLHKTDEGEWIAYSRWPSRQTRDASWGDNSEFVSSEEITSTIEDLKSCRDISKPHGEICMDVVADLLLG